MAATGRATGEKLFITNLVKGGPASFAVTGGAYQPVGQVGFREFAGVPSGNPIEAMEIARNSSTGDWYMHTTTNGWKCTTCESAGADLTHTNPYGGENTVQATLDSIYANDVDYLITGLQDSITAVVITFDNPQPDTNYRPYGKSASFNAGFIRYENVTTTGFTLKWPNGVPLSQNGTAEITYSIRRVKED